MEKDILEKWDDPVYRAVDQRCRYWLLAPVKGSDDISQSRFVEGVIRLNIDEKIIWEPLEIVDKLLFNRYIFSYEDFIKLLIDIHGIEKITPEYYLKTHQTRLLRREYVNKGIYIEHSIPSVYRNCGGINVHVFCENYADWEEILNVNIYKEEY